MNIDIEALCDALARVIEQREHASVRIKVERKNGNEKDGDS